MDYKKIFHYFIFLLILGVLAGGLLATINSFTAPIIEEAKEAEVQQELRNLFGNDSNFPSITKPEGTTREIVDIYQWYDATDTLKGIVYKTTTKGYGGDVTIIVAFSATDNTVIGFSVVDVSKETSGFGSQAATHDFAVNGQTAGSITITPISGSTRTSNAVNKGIQLSSANYLLFKSTLIGGADND